MDKTIKDYLNLLPEPARTLALKNSNEKFINQPALNAHIALSQAFLWFGSPEGHAYWENVQNDLRKEHQS